MLKSVIRILGAGALAGIAVLAFFLLKPVPETIKPIAAGAGVQYWTMSGGYRIAYRRIAPVPRATYRSPVIFLHGGPGGYVHSAIVKTLSPLALDGREVYFYDQSGTGLSDRRRHPKDTTIESHLADLEAIRRHIGAEKVVLVGHSFGGLLAALYAADHPERIEALILSSPGVIQPEHFDADGKPETARLYPVPPQLTFDPPADYAELTGARQMPLRAMAAFTVAQAFDIKVVPDREMDAAINTMASRFTRAMVCDPGHVRPEEGGAGGYSRVGTNFYPDSFKDPRPAMRKVTAPVLILQGECDFLAYSDVYEYVDQFPRASYRFVPKAGHIIWWDQPDAYLGAVKAFLSADTETASRLP